MTSVVSLRRDAVTFDGESTYLSLGTDPIRLPDAVGSLLRQLLDVEGTGFHDDNPWIFQGQRPGSHLTTAALRLPLTKRGINIRAAQHVALLTLARDLPPSVLADLLGISITAAERWSTHSAHDWTDYPRVRLTTGPG
ncbi:MAG TPA: hypothetical protein VIG71_05835 [Enteractinococcus sp.]